MIIERRALLRGMFAMPAVIAVSSLMPIRAPALLMPWQIGAEWNGIPFRSVKEATDAVLLHFEKKYPLTVHEPAQDTALITVRHSELLVEPRFTDWSWKDGKHLANGDMINLSWRRNIGYGPTHFEANPGHQTS